MNRRRSRPLWRMALSFVVAMAAILSGFFALAETASAQKRLWYGVGHQLSSNSHACLGSTSTPMTHVLGARTFVRYRIPTDVDSHNEKINAALWVPTTAGCGSNASWFEVGYSTGCNRPDNPWTCDSEHPAVAKVYVGESVGGGSGYGRIFPDEVLTASDLEWLDFVVLSRDATGQSWWGGVSGGGGWLITRDGIYDGHDRGRAVELGSEVWSNDGPNEFIIPKTPFTWIESSRPPTRDTGWNAFPYLTVYKEDSPVHVVISGVNDMYTCASGTVDCTQ